MIPFPRYPLMVLTLAASLAVCGTLAFAETKPSADTCGQVGMMNVECFNCKTGAYLGLITVQAGYDEHNKDCLSSKAEARDRCAGAYGVPAADIGIRWKYTLGMTEWKNWSPRSNCPAAAW